MKMSKLNIGDYNTLTVVKVALRDGNGDPFGLYLDGGREGEILMPEKYVPEANGHRRRAACLRIS